jgi:hypothetical protein
MTAKGKLVSRIHPKQSDSPRTGAESRKMAASASRPPRIFQRQRRGKDEESKSQEARRRAGELPGQTINPRGADRRKDEKRRVEGVEEAAGPQLQGRGRQIIQSRRIEDRGRLAPAEIEVAVPARIRLPLQEPLVELRRHGEMVGEIVGLRDAVQERIEREAGQQDHHAGQGCKADRASRAA